MNANALVSEVGTTVSIVVKKRRSFLMSLLELAVNVGLFCTWFLEMPSGKLSSTMFFHNFSFHLFKINVNEGFYLSIYNYTMNF